MDCEIFPQAIYGVTVISFLKTTAIIVSIIVGHLSS